jgi:single-strand DNA-binding protein
MASFNLVVLIGHLVADPELKNTTSGVPVTSFRIGVTRRFSQGDQQQTDFFDIVCWRKNAEFATKYFSKGKPILVRGTLQTRNWTDNNNVKHYATEIVADEIAFVGRKDDSPAGVQSGSAPAPNYSTPKAEGSFEELSADDELPF